MCSVKKYIVMAILTNIDGVPLFSTVEEALQYAAQNGLTGYHTHIYQGQTGYMGGASHGAAATSSAGFQQQQDELSMAAELNASSSTNTSSGGGGY
jgi:hypothetical protein